jgi:hypothetical protein
MHNTNVKDQHKSDELKSKIYTLLNKLGLIFKHILTTLKFNNFFASFSDHQKAC